MRIFISGIFGACLLAAALPPAQAMAGGGKTEPDTRTVEMTPLVGPVLVNAGTGYLPARERMALRAGDRILVNQSARIALRWRDGCRVEFSNGKLLTVTQRSPCAFKANNPAPAGYVSGTFAGANAGTAAAGGAATLTSMAGSLGVTAASLAISTVGIVQAQREASKEKTRNTISIP